MMIPEISPAALGLHTFDVEPAAAASAGGSTAEASQRGHEEAEKTALALLFPLAASHLWFLNTLAPPPPRKAPVQKPPPSPE